MDSTPRLTNIKAMARRDASPPAAASRSVADKIRRQSRHTAHVPDAKRRRLGTDRGCHGDGDYVIIGVWHRLASVRPGEFGKRTTKLEGMTRPRSAIVNRRN